MMPEPQTDAPLPVLGMVSSQWTPPLDGTVTMHTGEPLPPGRVFLAPPPAEIGELFSAGSNMDAEKGADGQTGKRILSAGGGLLAGMAIVLIISLRGRISFDLTMGIIFYSLAGIVGAVVGFILARPRYETSFVGANGIASFEYAGANKPMKNVKVFTFDRAATLNTTMTRNYTNGAYTGTSYEHNWLDAAGRTAHKITGTFHNQDGNPPGDDPYWFANAAEFAWSNYQLPVMIDAVNRGEAVMFPVRGKGAVGVSLGGLLVEMGGKHEVMPHAEIGDFGIKNGEVTIARRDAKKGFLGMGADGIFKFPYAGLGNAQLFLKLLDATTAIARGE